MIKEFILGAKGWGEQLNANFREIKERLEGSESGISQHTTNKNNPHNVSKSDVELENVGNYGISDSTTTDSSNTYASSKAVKSVNDLASGKLGKNETAVDSQSLNGVKNTYRNSGAYLAQVNGVNGTMEIGQYIDFHVGDSNADYDGRLFLHPNKNDLQFWGTGDGAKGGVVITGGHRASVAEVQAGTNDINYLTPYRATFISSDERLKENIVEADIVKCLESINSFNLVRYSFKNTYIDSDEQSGDYDFNRLGFIAQDVKEKGILKTSSRKVKLNKTDKKGKVVKKEIIDITLDEKGAETKCKKIVNEKVESDVEMLSINLDQLPYMLVGAVQELTKIVNGHQKEIEKIRKEKNI